jgi:hypothetical protein
MRAASLLLPLPPLAKSVLAMRIISARPAEGLPGSSRSINISSPDLRISEIDQLQHGVNL